MSDPQRRSPPRLIRSVRVPTPGVRARVDYVNGDLINVSATGALIRANRTLAVGSEWPVILDIEVRQIDLSGRVVRCDAVAVELPSGGVLKRAAFSLGIVFTTVSSAAMQSIVQLCGGTLTVEELPHRILLVDDDPPSIARLTLTLIELGYQVRSVTDARQVVNAAKDSRADAVVIHLTMEREPSMWWALEVLQSDPATARLPVVALTDALAMDEHRAQYLAERKVRIVTSPTAEAIQPALQATLESRFR